MTDHDHDRDDDDDTSAHDDDSPIAGATGVTPETAPRRRGRPPTHGRYVGARKNRRKVQQPADPTVKPRDDMRAPEPETIDGLMVHGVTSTVDGTVRWSHPLFPTEKKTAAEMGAYDIADHEWGQPTEIALQRKTQTGKLESCDRRFSPAEISESTICRMYGGGTYWVRAIAQRVVEGDRVVSQCTRSSWLHLPGPAKPLATQELAPEPEEDDDEEEEEIITGGGRRTLSIEVELARLNLEQRKIELDAAEARREKEYQRQEERMRRERDEDRQREARQRVEDDRRAEEARKRDQQWFMNMLEFQNQKNSQPVTPPPNSLVDTLNVHIAKIIADKLTGGEGSGGGTFKEIGEQVFKPMIEQAGSAALGWMQMKQAEAEAIRAKAEADAGWEEEEEEEEEEQPSDNASAAAASPPPTPPAPAPPRAVAPPTGAPAPKQVAT